MNLGHVFCEMGESGADDVNQAVDAAAKAQVEWGSLSGWERSKILLDAARLLEV